MPSGFLIKANANLVVAKYCLENGFYDACANRSYYAAFQAAIAALAAPGSATGKNEHKWVGSSLRGDLIKRRRLSSGRFSHPKNLGFWRTISV